MPALSRRIVVVLFALVLCFGGSANAADGDVPPVRPAPVNLLEGTVAEISGPASIHLGEHISGVVRFARLSKTHAVVIRWVDTKGRICAESSREYGQPTTAAPYDFFVADPIGTNHHIECVIDGHVQPVSHGFFVQRPYGPWIDYQACVWAHYDQGFAEQLRGLGINGSIYTGQGTTDMDFGFYPDNICYEVFSYYHKRREEDAAIHAAQFKTPNNPVLFHRRPSLTDEGTWDKVKDRLLRVVDEVKGYRPLFYNVADEIGISDQSQPSDFDWEYSSRDAWRTYLERHYVTVDHLNAEWGTHYENWGAVRAFFPQTDAMYYQIWRDVLLPAEFPKIDDFNKKFGTGYASFDAVVHGYRAVCTDDEGMTLDGLKKEYKNIENLNEALGTPFKDHEAAAAYLAAFEQWVGTQNGADTRNWNLAWWCDFRDYMDEYMANGLKRACDMGRAADPGGRFGITGTHHPGVFNGHNYAKILPGIDAIIPYDIGQSFELIRGLDPRVCFMHPTWATGNKLQRDLWYYFLHGARGVLFWDNDEASNRLINKATGATTTRGLAAAPVLQEIGSGIDRLLLAGARENNGIAIYHSQASVRVTWFQNYINLGRRWMTRHSSDEYKGDESSVLRTSWIKLIEDNHLQFIFVTPEQVAAGRLKSEAIRVLILPEVWALSDDEARNIEAFVAAGGSVIADQHLGLYDEHGKRRPVGVMDSFFGINQTAVHGDARRGTEMTHPPGDAVTVPPAPAARLLLATLSANLPKGLDLNSLSTTGTPGGTMPLVPNSGAKALAGDSFNAALIVRTRRFSSNEPGMAEVINAAAIQTPPSVAGETVFLNLDLSRYSQTRMENQEKTEQLVALLRAVLPPAVQPAARVQNAAGTARQPGTEVGVWDLGGTRHCIAVWHNIEMRKEGIGGEALTDNGLFEKDAPVKVVFDHEQYAVNTRVEVDYGKTGAVETTLSPWLPILLTVQDTPFVKPSLLAPAEATRGSDLTLTINGDMQIGNALQVFRVDATNPAGQAVWYYTKKVDTRTGQAVVTLPLALNEMQGAWSFKLTDVATRFTSTATVTVK